MASVQDVAAYILEKQGQMTAMKLQKLVYYSQAWSLVWDEKPLFAEKIKAWTNGPVVPELYKNHKGQFTVSPPWSFGTSSALTTDQRETVDAVLRTYGAKTSQWLSDLTHRENPWRDAREGVPDGESSSAEITPAALAEYYSGLTEADQAI